MSLASATLVYEWRRYLAAGIMRPFDFDVEIPASPAEAPPRNKGDNRRRDRNGAQQFW